MSAQQLTSGRPSCARVAARGRVRVRCSASAPQPQSPQPQATPQALQLCRRGALRAALLAGAAAAAAAPQAAWAYATNRQGDDDFTVLPSGLRYLDLREGTGDTPRAGACASTAARGSRERWALGAATGRAERSAFVRCASMRATLACGAAPAHSLARAGVLPRTRVTLGCWSAARRTAAIHPSVVRHTFPF
jgi:hypothetical protein